MAFPRSFRLRLSLVTVAVLLTAATAATAADQDDLASLLQRLQDELAAGRHADALVTASGLASKVLEPGIGSVHPAAEDTVEVHYTGWTTDGEMFDSSVARGKKVGLQLDRVIAGWTEGLQLMPVGSKYKFFIPANEGLLRKLKEYLED